ncbi:MAG: glutamine-hydrolyzing carbamoyl-phosphate synthase small subunit [Microthrixaceae bacterium]
MNPQPAAILLADGTLFEGEAFGPTPPTGITTGEFVFNTVLSGYQEVISDPSYAGQIITFTAPHIGNYGTNSTDNESAQPRCEGIVVRELSRSASNWRAEGDLVSYLKKHGVAGIGGIDTRRLTRHLRENGAIPGAFGTASEQELREAALLATGTEGKDLVARVTTSQPYSLAAVNGSTRRIVALDLGIKTTILRNLAQYGTVEVVPASTSAEQILALQPDGVFVSNGPGDPAAVAHVPDTLRQILGKVPIFGICMGHQMLATALGGTTYKLPFGHHGGNHPVRDLTTEKVEITSQNHNYCVNVESLSNVQVTHRNLNDSTVEGFECPEFSAFAVQHHPESGPGPHDSKYLFERFAELMDRSAP